LDRALNVSFLVLFDILFRALVVVLIAFDVEGLFGGGVSDFLRRLSFGHVIGPTQQNQLDRSMQ
jgi:hypothetical protein